MTALDLELKRDQAREASKEAARAATEVVMILANGIYDAGAGVTVETATKLGDIWGAFYDSAMGVRDANPA